jgi:SAM-dependent methyltransferase
MDDSHSGGDERPRDADNTWDSGLYDDSHSFVYEYGEDLLGLLEPNAGERILDLGCGTGHLPRRIADEGADVVGVDTASDMLVQADAEHSHVEFLRGDARGLPFAGAFDAVFSNAALHWIPEAETVIEHVRAALGADGRFVAEFGGRGNVETIVSEMVDVIRAAGYEPHNPWYFPSVAEYTILLERHGLEPRYVGLFDRPTELDGEDGLRNRMAMFTDSFFAEVPDGEREELIQTIEDRLRGELYDPDAEIWVADYRRLRVEAHVDERLRRPGT